MSGEQADTAFSEAVEVRRCFEAEELVAGRFRIVRFLGEGAMGQVFEAEDLELVRRVALKTVHEGSAQAFFERFKREVALATRVTHRNVCRVFDVGRHRKVWPSGVITDLVFLTMEVLEGETLRTRLARGRLGTEEALPLLAQIAAALDAAHQAGVVHRDLKPENVALVPGSAGLRVVVTDFGIARSTEGGPELARTGSGQVVGTPAYMSPEQAKGQPPAATSDVYAFGLVMFELLTGRLPEGSVSGLTMLMKRISEPPRSPRELLPDLDVRWERAILRCLATEPSERFASAGAAIAALASEASPGPSLDAATTPPPRGRTRARRLAAWGAVGAVLAVTALGLGWLGRRGRAAAARKTVAVLGFKNTAGRGAEAWISTALAEMLTTELAVGRRLRALPGEPIADAKRELNLPDADGFGAESLKRIQRRLGADYVVVGSFLAPEGTGRLRVDLKVQDVASGETIAAQAEEGLQSELPDVVARAGIWLRQTLEAGPVEESQAAALRTSAPPSFEAARLYALGLERQRRFQTRAALEHFRAAAEHAPAFTLARARLAESLFLLGREREAVAEARIAFDGSTGLPHDEKLLVEALYRQVTQDNKRAVDVCRALFAAAPDDLDHGLRLARAQVRASAHREALRTLAALRRLPGPAGEDPRIPAEEATALHFLGEFPAMLERSAEAERKATASDARALLPRVLREKGVALYQLGRLSEGVEALERAGRLFAETQQEDGLVWVGHSMASVRRQQGRLTEALRLIDEAQATSTRLGLITASFVPYTRGSVLVDLGRLDEGERSLQECVEMTRSIEVRTGYYAQYELGRVLALRGDLTGAAARLSEVERLCRSLSAARILARTLHLLGLVRMQQGDLEAARRLLREAVELLSRDGEGSVHQNTAMLSLAILDLEEGRAEPALEAAQRTARTFSTQGAEADRAVALAVVARALEELRRPAQAKGALEEALRPELEGPEWKVRRGLQAALALLRRGEPAAAERLAAEALAVARSAEFPGSELEARLVLAQATRAAGSEAEARRELALVEKVATIKGYGLIARRAGP